MLRWRPRFVTIVYPENDYIVLKHFWHRSCLAIDSDCFFNCRTHRPDIEFSLICISVQMCSLLPYVDNASMNQAEKEHKRRNGQRHYIYYYWITKKYFFVHPANAKMNKNKAKRGIETCIDRAGSGDGQSTCRSENLQNNEHNFVTFIFLNICIWKQDGSALSQYRLL